MTNTFKALSALLSYPTAELKAAAKEIRATLKSDSLAPSRILAKLDFLIDELISLDLYELQERYVFLFDRTRSLSLHLFEHVHGESRDRGQAMVDLQALYRQAGLEVAANELPDFLPLFLEFLSLQPVGEARTLLKEPLAVISALKERLEKRNSPYAAVFRVLETIPEDEPDAEALNDLRRAQDDDPDDLGAVDALWEEAPVTFGPTAGCPKADELVARMRTDEIPPRS